MTIIMLTASVTEYCVQIMVGKYAILVAGTVYFQTMKPVLVISGFCVYSVASALFMFPVLQNYYLKSLEVSWNYIV